MRRNRIVLKPSRHYFALGLLLAMLGASAGYLFIVEGKIFSSGDVMGYFVVSIGTGAFVVLGLALAFKSSAERVIVYATGVAKHSAPSGERTFQCIWDEVMDYSWAAHGMSWTDSYGDIAYVLTSPKAQLKVGAGESYFPQLHSLILSRLPTNVKVKLRSTTVPKGEPIEGFLEFREGVFARSCSNLLAGSILLIVGAGLPVVVWMNIDTYGSRFVATSMGLLVAYVGYIMVSGDIAGHNSEVFRIDAVGVSKSRRGRRVVRIPWDEIKAVQYLYRSDNRSKSDSDDMVRVYSGPPFTDHYAIIGTEGKCIWFDSVMRDFPAFLNALERHSPQHVVLDINT